MATVRRRRGSAGVTITLSDQEVMLVRGLVSDVDQMLAARGPATDDPFADLMAEPVDAPTDPALARLLPDGHRDDPEAAAELRRLSEGTVRQQKTEAARCLLDTLPEGGGTAKLDDEHAQAWLTALNDVRLVLGTRLEVTEESDPLGGYEADEPEAVPYVVYHWLTGLQDDLIKVAAGW